VPCRGWLQDARVRRERALLGRARQGGRRPSVVCRNPLLPSIGPDAPRLHDPELTLRAVFPESFDQLTDEVERSWEAQTGMPQHNNAVVIGWGHLQDVREVEVEGYDAALLSATELRNTRVRGSL